MVLNMARSWKHGSLELVVFGLLAAILAAIAFPMIDAEHIQKKPSVVVEE
jgi:hypothetical protein